MSTENSTPETGGTQAASRPERTVATAVLETLR